MSNLTRKQKDEQILNALYHYLDHKLLSQTESAETILENHDVANVALSYATLLSEERFGRTNLFLSFGAFLLSLVSIAAALLISLHL